MEKELKISELALHWGTSVPTTWNRIRKEGLTTFKKKDENNKEVTYVRISDEILNSYVNNVVNNNLNNNNNGYYEDMLTVNNINNDVNNVKSPVNTSFSKEDLKEIINTITTANNDYNNRLEQLTNRVINAESKQLLLEDKANREGFYLNEINELKKENNRNKLYNKILITVITILLLFITGVITYNMAGNNKPVQTAPELEQTTVQAPTGPITSTEQAVPAKKSGKKK